VSYTAAIESAETKPTAQTLSPFAQRVEREARRSGFAAATRQVVIGDGAAWLWNIASECFPHAIQILDKFHAKEHVYEVAKRTRACSDRAFAKMRRGFSAQLFDRLNDTLMELARPFIDRHRWQGLRVVAADGSRLQVSTRRGADLQADHYAFALYLPGSELTLHASLHAADGSERQMLFEALDVIQPQTDVLVLDRGYPSHALAAVLSQSQRQFCWRVDATGWTCVRHFLHSGKSEALVALAAPSAADATTYAVQRTSTTVRLTRDVTPSGTVRVLMTSLLDGQLYPAARFGALYHCRWRVEEAFKRIKHRLRLKATTGLTHLAFQQDFAAKIVADNLHGLLAQTPTGGEPEPATPSRPNRTFAIGTLKPILAGCLLHIRHCLGALAAALDVIVRTRCRIQPGRAYPRPPRTKPHTYAAYKLCC
jgi:hypothetical protein